MPFHLFIQTIKILGPKNERKRKSTILTKLEEPATPTLFTKRARPSDGFYSLIADENTETGPSSETTNPSPQNTETGPSSETTNPSPQNTETGPSSETTNPSSQKTETGPSSETTNPSPQNTETGPSSETTNPSLPSTSTNETTENSSSEIAKPKKPRKTMHGWLDPIIEELLIIGSFFMSRYIHF